MADITSSTWDQNDDDNDAASPAGAPEGMSPGGVNNTIRAMMGALKRAYVWSETPTTTTGTSTAYVLSYSVAPAALVDGMTHAVLFHTGNGSNPTLNINSLGAKPLHYFTGSAWAVVPSGLIKSSMVCLVYYYASAGTYRIRSFPSAVGTATLGGDNTFTGANTFSGALTMSGAAINEAKGADIASASTINLTTATGNVVDVTGTTAVTAITLTEGAERTVRTTGALTWTHGASLVLPTGDDITSAAGDYFTFRGYSGGVVRMTGHQLASGKALASSLTTLTDTLTGDVALNDTGQYFDGPKVAQGTTGTWLAMGSVNLSDTAGAAEMNVKLWDGTTVVASTEAWPEPGRSVCVTLYGVFANPAGDIRISVNDASTNNGVIAFNASSNSKDATLTVVRIA